jgi:hypothetical protein
MGHHQLTSACTAPTAVLSHSGLQNTSMVGKKSLRAEYPKYRVTCPKLSMYLL